MRERAKDKGRLEDIIQHSQNVMQWMEGTSIKDFISDTRTYYAVMKNVEIVGEAAYMLTNEFKEKHPETPWKMVQGMRHYLVHGYSHIDKEELYDTALNGIPELCRQVYLYLKGTDWEAWENTQDDII